MKTKLISLAVAASMSLMISATSHAEDEAYQGSWYAMPTVGYANTDSTLQADDDVSYGVRLGKELSQHWDVQLGLTSTNPDAKSTIQGIATTGDYRQTVLGVDALYMFSRDALRPFVLAGVGVAQNNLNYNFGGVGVNGSNTSWMANVGAGVQYFINDSIGLQADIRHVWSEAEASATSGGQTFRANETVGNTLLNFGLIFKFGAPVKTAMAEPMMAKPAMMDEPAMEAVPEEGPDVMEDLPPMMDDSLEPQAEAMGPDQPAFAPITLAAEVLFGFDKDSLKEEGKRILNVEVVEKMRTYPEVELVLISGHTDRIGDDNYNQKLSERRAKQVKKYIASQGIAESRLHAVGKGEKEPVADCTGIRGKKLIECLQPNRRVVVEIEVQRQMAH
ncbi:MAG: OmpA family protein [Methylophilaceae bacterium]